MLRGFRKKQKRRSIRYSSDGPFPLAVMTLHNVGKLALTRGEGRPSRKPIGRRLYRIAGVTGRPASGQHRSTRRRPTQRGNLNGCPPFSRASRCDVDATLLHSARGEHINQNPISTQSNMYPRLLKKTVLSTMFPRNIKSTHFPFGQSSLPGVRFCRYRLGIDGNTSSFIYTAIRKHLRTGYNYFPLTRWSRFAPNREKLLTKKNDQWDNCGQVMPLSLWQLSDIGPLLPGVLRRSSIDTKKNEIGSARRRRAEATEKVTSNSRRAAGDVHSIFTLQRRKGCCFTGLPRMLLARAVSTGNLEGGNQNMRRGFDDIVRSDYERSDYEYRKRLSPCCSNNIVSLSLAGGWGARWHCPRRLSTFFVTSAVVVRVVITPC